MAAPSGYDRSKGWQDGIGTWEADDPVPVAAVGHDRVAYLDYTGGAYVLKVRDAATGKLRWSGKPRRPLKRDDNDFDAPAGKQRRPPYLAAMTIDGKPYLVAYEYGTTGASGMEKEHEEMRFDAYAADSSGSGVAPVRTTELRGGDYGQNYGHPTSVDTAGRYLVMRSGDMQRLAVDVLAGRIKGFDETDIDGGRNIQDGRKECPECRHGLISSTPDGALVMSDGKAKGAWTVKAPGGMRAGTLIGSGGGYTVFGWRPESDSKRTVWTVNKVSDGSQVASVDCGLPYAVASDVDAKWAQLPLHVSANGRYLVAGLTAFDLQAGKGYCYAGTDDRKGADLTEVTNSGAAYGNVDDGDYGQPDKIPDPNMDGPPPSVSVTIGHGRPAELPDGQQAPVAQVGRTGLFLTGTDGNHPHVVALQRDH